MTRRRTPRRPSRLPAPTRRSFLLGAGAAGLALATGCAGSDEIRSFDLGGSGQLAVLNWADYIDPDEAGLPGTVSRLQAETAILVDYVEGFDGNVEAWEEIIEPNLSSGRPTGYDIIVPTNWLAARMVELGWAQPLPLEVIPNHVNIDPAYLTMPWDRGARFHMPWQAGITGIAYDPAQTGREINSIADLYDPELAGRVGMVVEMRETVGFAMLLAGDDPSRPTVDTANAAMDTVEAADAAGQIGHWTANEFSDLLASGELAAAMAWSGDIVQLQRDRPDLAFVIPEEGAIRWFDTMVIPALAPSVAAAGARMDFVYDPANAARITAWVQYISPVVGVREELQALGGEAAELADNPILFPDDETTRRLFTWGGLPAEDEEALEARFASIIE